MQFPRKKLTNLDLCPFAAVACDSNGFVIYKNELTRKLYKNVHVGARLSTYTSVDTAHNHIEINDFYGERCTLFIYNLEDAEGAYTVITVFSVGFCNTDLYRNSVTELENAVTSLLNQDTSDGISEKRSFLRAVAKKHELARKCGAFASSYLENIDLFSYDVVNATDFIARIVNIINNRLGLDVKLEMCDLTDCIPYVKITKATVLVLLNFINFAILNSDRNVTVTVSTSSKEVNVSFEYHSKHIFENIFTSDAVAYYTFMLLTGIDTAEQNNTRISLTNQDGRSSVDTYFPLEISKDMTFKSSDILDKMIEEYIKLSQSYFKD